MCYDTCTLPFIKNNCIFRVSYLNVSSLNGQAQGGAQVQVGRDDRRRRHRHAGAAMITCPFIRYL